MLPSDIFVINKLMNWYHNKVACRYKSMFCRCYRCQFIVVVVVLLLLLLSS